MAGAAPQDPGQESEGDMSECELEAHVADTIQRAWHPRKNPYSKSWQQLVHRGRPLLMELACFPDSVLSEAVIKKFGEGSAIRMSHWNGADLETPSGVQHAIQVLKKTKPVNLWISCECSPFCPLQRLNRRNPEQIRNLEGKQQRAIRQYKGGLQVAEAAIKLGTQVHWELSERCEAWKLDFLTDFLEHYRMQKAICHGCTVGLRTKDQSKILCKGWGIATTNPQLAQHMNLRCQKNHAKGEAGQTAHTSRYTHQHLHNE